MIRARRLPPILVLGIAGFALAGADFPPAFVKSSPGGWEMSGIPGTKGPARLCLRDLRMLAQVEHRGRHCADQLVSAGPVSTIISYTCSPGNFGRSKIDLITPRSFRIETQGIADNLPFAYVVQARRIGDCPAASAPDRH